MASIPFLGSPDLLNLDILNAALQKLASDPSSPVEGFIFAKTGATDRVRVRLDGAWKDLAFTTDIAGVGAGTIGTTELADDGVTYAKIQEMAANTVMANTTGGAANPTGVTKAALITWLGLTLGDISGDGALAALNTVGTSQIDDDAVTVGKMAQMAANTVLSNITGSTADPVANTKAAFITWLALSLADISGDGALAALNTVGTSQIDNDAVTYAKIQNISATARVLGRITAGSGDAEELTGANIRTILGTLDADTVGGQSAAAIVTSAANTIRNGAGAAYDTLIEIQTLLEADDTADALISAAVANKNAKGVAADLGTASADAVHNHALGTRDVICQLLRKADWKHVEAPYTVTDTNNVTWNLPAAPASGEYRSIIIPAAA
jgi:hypothetical protein